MPDTDYSIGQDLRLTIESVYARAPPPGVGVGDDAPGTNHKLDTLRAHVRCAPRVLGPAGQG